MARDSLRNGMALGGVAGGLAVLVPQISEYLMSAIPEPYNTKVILGFALVGIGALVGLIIDKY